MHILNQWGIKGVLHEQCGSFVLQWKDLMVGCRRGRCRLLILSYVIWSLWFERNKAKFEEYAPNLNFLVNTLKIRIGVWAKELLGITSFSPQDCMNNIEAIL